MEQIMVSVACTAFNHEKYIRKTLEGFVNQKTTFPFEVIVHDDASTDGTAAIINEYAERYPDIIKPIYQSENQYSKGLSVLETHIFPRMQGKYLAFCEGDDYWCSTDKLQRQYDALEKHPEAQLCVHYVKTVMEDGTETGEVYPKAKLGDSVLTSDEFINLVCDDFFQLTSYFVHMDLYKQYREKKPDYARNVGVGDVPLLLYIGSHSEQIVFLDEVMSAYRKGSIGSWNSRISRNISRILDHRDKMLRMAELFDKETNRHYTDSCNKLKRNEQYSAYFKTWDIIPILKDAEFRARFYRLSLRSRVSLIVRGTIQIVKRWINK